MTMRFVPLFLLAAAASAGVNPLLTPVTVNGTVQAFFERHRESHHSGRVPAGSRIDRRKQDAGVWDGIPVNDPFWRLGLLGPARSLGDRPYRDRTRRADQHLRGPRDEQGFMGDPFNWAK